MTDTAPPLRAWLDQAWDDHPSEPERVAAALAARAAELRSGRDAAEAIRLATHVMLAHLGDAPALDGFIATLSPADEETAAAAERARWSLARLRGSAEPPLADAARFGALQDAVLGAVRARRCGEAAQWLAEVEADAIGHPEAAARRAYAASANNVALDLRVGPRGDDARDALMLEAAAIAARAWAAAGTWLNVERAEYQLARCHAVLGDGERALAHARRCLALCEAERADAFERFFAHEALAIAHRVSGDEPHAAHHRAEMQRELERIDDPGLRAWCTSALAASGA